jgi:integrase
MNIRKRSGKYQLREMRNGKLYTMTVELDHKPGVKEAEELMKPLFDADLTVSASTTFKGAYEAYIEAKSNILSPSTIRGYKQYIKNVPDIFMKTKLAMITKPMVQAEINRFSVDHAPKTVRNYSGLIMSVLFFYGKEIKGITLPQKEKKTPYIPTKEEVSAIFKEIKGSPFEAAIMLSACGLRRSEICAAQLEDLSEDNVLTINKALVKNTDREWVIKPTKTTDSTRTVVIPDYLADLIRKQGYIYNGFPDSIRKHLLLVQKKLGIQQFSLHKMRHFYASYLHSLGYSDKQIQEAGGWKDGSNVMRTVYQHAMDMEETKKKMSDNIGSLI